MLPLFDNLTAKRIVRQDLIEKKAGTTRTAIKEYDTAARKAMLESFSNVTAAASMAQVYKAYLPGYGTVAVNIQRLGIRRKVESDATLFHSLAAYLQSASRLRPVVSFNSEDGFQLKLVTIHKDNNGGSFSQ